jgi:tyrosyl-tRNA synthetase
MSVFDVLQERGFIQQTTHQEPLLELLEKEKVTFYIGFDPTADSLHAGSLLPIMAMAHMQRAGHRPIVILGGGTAMIGDPSGKTEMRKMITREIISYNASRFKEQLSRFIDFSDGKALMINNGDWLLKLNYIEFLREIGSQFSVNRMLTAECFKARLEKGLSFIEFNYMLLQSYDFLVLFREYGCKLQMGGDDQWSNILYGADLIRRLEGGKEAYGITFPLLTTAGGRKMGKTEAGAVWLDPGKTSPYEYYQYWRNSDDRDVGRFLALYTFLPMDEVRRLSALKDRETNEAKKILAYEVTKLTHGEEEAKKAVETAAAFFSGGNEQAMPSLDLPYTELKKGISIVDLIVMAKLADSRSDAKRLITQGGISLNDQKVTDLNQVITEDDANDNRIVVRKGKKEFQVLKFDPDTVGPGD